MLEWGNLEHHIKNLKRSVGEVVEIILFDKFSCTWWIALLLHSRKQKLGFAFNSKGYIQAPLRTPCLKSIPCSFLCFVDMA